MIRNGKIIDDEGAHELFSKTFANRGDPVQATYLNAEKILKRLMKMFHKSSQRLKA